MKFNQKFKPWWQQFNYIVYQNKDCIHYVRVNAFTMDHLISENPNPS
jgi:hypothetical protein